VKTVDVGEAVIVDRREIVRQYAEEMGFEF